MHIRASSLPLAMICPASSQPAEYELNSESEAARLGTAVHEWLARKISSEVFGDEFFEQLAVKHDLAIEELQALSWRAFRLWREVEQYFPNPSLEVELKKDLGRVQLTGHVDVLSYRAEQRMVFVDDHKTGFLDGDHSDQVRAYGLMALDKFPEADQVHTCITRVRDFVTDHANYSRNELNAWAERVQHRLTVEAQTYNPGRHCSFCPRRYTCPAFRDWVKWAVKVLDDVELILIGGTRTQDDLDPTHPEVVRRMYDAKAALSRLVAEATEVLRTLAMEHGGSLKRDDGQQLQIISQIRQTILFREAWDILSKRVPEDHWNDVFKVNKTDLLQVIRFLVGKGEKKRAVDELMTQLEEANALEQTTVDRMELKKLEAIAA